MTGTIKGIIAKLDDGCGAIARGSQLVYFHHTVVEGIRFGQLETGRTVEYELADNPCPLQAGYQGGPQAIAVRPT